MKILFFSHSPFACDYYCYYNYNYNQRASQSANQPEVLEAIAHSNIANYALNNSHSGGKKLKLNGNRHELNFNNFIVAVLRITHV
jgi:hypothetical protein